MSTIMKEVKVISDSAVFLNNNGDWYLLSKKNCDGFVRASASWEGKSIPYHLTERDNWRRYAFTMLPYDVQQAFKFVDFD